MKTLGLDISTVSTGWAVLADPPETPNEPKLIDYGCIDFKYSEKISSRIMIFREAIKGILKLNPDVKYVIIEDTYIAKNPKTTKQLNRFAGVAIEAVMSESSDMLVLCVTAMTVRSAIRPGIKTGKEDIYKIMREWHNLPIVPDDITDAIADAWLPFKKRIEDKWII
jgi:Holliday junction resolvasome RuvABC endonuclease subunit